MATQEGFGEQIWGTLFDPGGDPGAIYRAAGACRKLARDLSTMLTELDPVATGLKSDWKGPAADAYQQAYAKFSPAMADYVTHLYKSADSLDKVGDAVHEAQVQARNFKIMIAVTIAALAVTTVLTLGIADAPELAALDTEAGIVATGLARLGMVIAGEAEAMSALVSAMEAVAWRFVIGVAGTLVTSMGSKWILQGKNPLDSANYSAKDGTDLLLGGVLTAGLGTLATTGKVAGLLQAHKVLGVSGLGALGGFSGSAVNQFWLAGRSPLDPGAWGNIGLSTVLAGTAGAIVGKFTPVAKFSPSTAGGLLRPNGEPLFPSGVFPRPANPDWPDVGRGSIGVVAGTLGYPLNVQEPKRRDIPGPSPMPAAPSFPVPPPGTLPGLAGVPGAPGGAPSTGPGGVPGTPGGTIPPPPNVPAPHVIPQHTVTVHRGDTLSEIALRELGDGAKHSYDDLARINGIANPDLIYPGQKIIIPEIIIPAALQRTG